MKKIFVQIVKWPIFATCGQIFLHKPAQNFLTSTIISKKKQDESGQKMSLPLKIAPEPWQERQSNASRSGEVNGKV